MTYPNEAHYADRATYMSAVMEFERTLETAAGECTCSIVTPLTEDQRIELAHRAASLAVDLDRPDTVRLADILHDVAEELAGDRVDEIYAGGGG